MRLWPNRMVLFSLFSLALLAATPAVAAGQNLHLVNSGADSGWREADRARRELQRQQRVIECQNRVLAQQRNFASPSDFLRARQACASTR